MSKVINITRTKNDYTFYLDNGKTARYNCETKIKIGVSGKQVKKLSYESRFCHILTEENYSSSAREFFDRLISLPIDYEKKEQVIVNLGWCPNYPYFLENWKSFIKYLKTSMEMQFSEWFTLEEVRKTLSKIEDDEFIKALYHSGYCYPNLIKKYSILAKELTKISKKIIDTKKKRLALMGEKTEEECCREYGIVFRNVYDMYYPDIGKVVCAVRDIDNILKKLNLTDYKITNIENDVRDLQSMLDKKESEQFTKHQNEGNLEYENERYKIIVPQTRTDLAYYGNHFHNCLNGHEWINYLSTLKRYAVIVYDKEKEKPVVCADIEVTTRRIYQYLAEYNHWVNDDKLCDFYREYQEFLKNEKGE